MKNPLNDKDFLVQLDNQHNREVYAKVIALTFDERPVEEAIGRITQGSISVDGNSSVRRTCSLTMVANEMNLHDYYWGFKTKFRLEVGLKNNINSEYPEIIWFPQGIYVITSFNTSQGISSYTINLQGKDKMSLLNGDLGGAVTSLSWDFGKFDTINEDGSITQTDYLLKDIITQAVHEFAREPFHNIIINDLDDLGLELLEYRGRTPMYLVLDNDADLIDQFYLSDNVAGFYRYDNEQPIMFSDENFVFDPRIQLDLDSKAIIPTYLKVKDAVTGTFRPTKFSVIKIELGDVVGYKTTDLTYAGDLILKTGDTITSLLDKIKGMLGEFEYFYNLDGQFVFQRKKNFIQTSWNNLIKDGSGQIYADNAAYVSPTTYFFENANIITSFSNNPDLMNLRNDYSIWGTKKALSGAEVPVHLRYAIDKKPSRYTTYDGSKTYSTKDYDWREIIFQMSQDYKQNMLKDDFCAQIALHNPDYPTGYTGYEQYYVDLDGFWRQLYNPNFVTESLLEEPKRTQLYYYIWDEINEKWIEYPFKEVAQIKNFPNNQTIWTRSGGKYVEAISFESTRRYFIKEKDEYIEYNIYEFIDKNQKYYKTNDFNPKTNWANIITEAPETLNFWFDFLDTEGELSQYSVYNVGIRPKAENDTNVKSIYFREVPTIIFVDNVEYFPVEGINELLFYEDIFYEKDGDEYKVALEYNKDTVYYTSSFDEERRLKPGYTFLQLPAALDSLFSLSSQGISAKDKLDSFLYNYSYCTASISLTTIPVYYLEPNTRIFIKDNNSGLSGEYVITRMTIPLGYSGTMNITATKAVDRII